MPADRPDVDDGARGVSPFQNWRFISFLGLPRWYAWASSAVFHAVAATAILTVTFPSVAHVRSEEPKDVPTVLKIGEKLYFVAKIQPAPRRAAAAPTARKAPPAPAPQPAKVEVPAPAPPAPPARAEAPKVFAPPQVKRNQVSEATVIQPQSAPDLVFQAVQPLPTFEIQSQNIRTPKPFVVPGRPAPKPVVETPNLPPPPQQLDLTRVAPVTFAPRSTLVLPPGPPAVIDARPPDVKTSVEAARVGDPISILSLSDVAVAPKPEIVVPPGNVLGRTGDGIVIVAGNNVAGGAVVGGEASAADRGPGSARPAAEGILPNGGRPPAGTPGAPASGGPAGAPPAPAPLKPNQIRRPNDGQFDAVVVQNTPTDQFPESRGLLTGRPIYSVYISVGTAKDWTLYFAVPGAPAPQQTGTRVVEVTAVTPVLAPYPVLIERPNTTIPAFFKYVLVYGTVNEAGRFQNLRVVRPTRPDADKALLAALANWEFRPASREGKKLGVEVLLYVPVDGL